MFRREDLSLASSLPRLSGRQIGGCRNPEKGELALLLPWRSSCGLLGAKPFPWWTGNRTLEKSRALLLEGDLSKTESGILIPGLSGPKGPRSSSSSCPLLGSNSLLLRPHKGTAPISENGAWTDGVCPGSCPCAVFQLLCKALCLFQMSLWTVPEVERDGRDPISKRKKRDLCLAAKKKTFGPS